MLLTLELGNDIFRIIIMTLSYGVMYVKKNNGWDTKKLLKNLFVIQVKKFSNNNESKHACMCMQRLARNNLQPVLPIDIS